MGAAFVAPGEALVDAIAVGLIGNNEDVAVGGCGRRGEQECAGNECISESHRAPGGKRDRSSQIDPEVNND